MKNGKERGEANQGFIYEYIIIYQNIIIYKLLFIIYYYSVFIGIYYLVFDYCNN